MKRIQTCLVAAIAIGASVSVAAAQQVKLRVADSLPVGHYISKDLLKPFMAQVEKATGKKVSFQYFPAQQLGKAKDMLSLTQTGVADIGYVGPSYIAGKMPLSSVGELPEAFSTSCQGTLAFWNIAKPGGVLDKIEFAPQGVRVLMVLVLPPYQIFSAKQITGLASLKGMTVRSTGGAKDIALTKLGAVPVHMAAPEARQALSRGTVDAIAFPISSVLPYDLQPYLKTATEGANFGSFVATYMISQKKYDSLPPDVRKAMDEAGEYATKSACAQVQKLTGVDQTKLAKDGVKFMALSKPDMTKLNKIMSTVGDAWADKLEKQGHPAKKVLAAFRASLSGK